MKKILLTILLIVLLTTSGALAQNLLVGEKAPDFTLMADNGKVYHLSNLVKKSLVVLYFYPKAMTPGCTKQACSIRDSILEFKKRGIVILGVSTDADSALIQFKEKEKLNFPLLADTDGKVSASYQVLNKEKNMARRVSYIIGKNRKIIGVIPKVDVNTHIQDILQIVENQKK